MFAGIKKRYKKQEVLTALVLLAPFLFILIVFYIFPIIYTTFLSFTKYTLLKQPEFWGLEGWKRVMSNQIFFAHALPNTFKFVAIIVPIQTALSLVLAFAMDQKIRFRRLFRTIYYLPSITSSVVISLIFVWMFSPIGIVNQIFNLDINWLNNTSTAIYTVMLVNIFTTTGTLMLIFLGGLQNIPQTMYEAAVVDGANKVQTFFHITIPMLRPVIFFVVTVGTIGCFHTFDQIFVMTEGGPLNTTTTLAYLTYQWAFRDTTIKMGQASVVAVVIVAITLVVVLTQRRVIEGSGTTTE